MNGHCKPIQPRLTRCVLVVHYGCNFRCRMCPNLDTFRAQEEKDMALADAERVIDQAAEAGVVAIRPYAVGEPTLYPHFEEICRYIATRQMGLELDATNGSRLADFSPDTFANPRHARVVVSIDAGTKATYENLRKKGMWDKLWQGLAHLQHSRASMPTLVLTARSILMRRTAEELPHLVPHLARFGLDRLQVIHCRETNTFKDENLQQEPLYVADVSGRIRAECEKHGITYLATIEETMNQVVGCRERTVRRTCLPPYEQSWVGINGDVTPCIQFAGRDTFCGNVHRSTLAEIFVSRFYASMRRAYDTGEIPALCHDCIVWR